MKNELPFITVQDMIPTWIDDRMRNWARWVADRWTPKTCYSAEGRYRPPRQDEATPAQVSTVDAIDAMALEKVMCFLPAKGRLMLKLHYVDHASKSEVRRKCSVPQDEYDAHLVKYAQMAINRAG